MTGNDVIWSHVTRTGSHVTGSYRVRTRNWCPRFFLTIVVVQNVSLRMTGSSMANGCDVTWRGSIGRVRCVHAQPEVAQYPPYWGLFTESDVIKRHVTPKGFTCKRGMRACATGSRGFSLLESLLTGNDLIKRHPHSFPWKIWERAYAIESAHGVLSRTFGSYNLIIFYELALSLASCPFPALLFSWGAPSIITQPFFGCFRICSRCCVILQGCFLSHLRSHCGISTK